VDAESAAAKLRLAFDMHEFGVQMFRQRLRRENPDAGPEWIEAEVRAWLAYRPGAVHGDAVGRVSHRFG
jgi:hypothetical protein